MGTAPIANTDRSVWKIDGIKVNPIGKADPDKQFAIQLKGENSTSFYLDSEGILVAINEQPKKNKHPLANKPHKPNDAPKYTFDKSDYAQLYTEEMLVAGSTAKMAESAAKQIYLLREYRLDLLTGNSDEIPQERSFEILLNEMNKREALLTSLFMGTVETESSVKHIIYLPPVNSEKHTSNEIAFRFSERNGIVAPDNLSGEPIYISVNGTQIGTRTDRCQRKHYNSGKRCAHLYHSRKSRCKNFLQRENALYRKSTAITTRCRFRFRSNSLYREESHAGSFLPGHRSSHKYKIAKDFPIT